MSRKCVRIDRKQIAVNIFYQDIFLYLSNKKRAVNTLFLICRCRFLKSRKT